MPLTHFGHLMHLYIEQHIQGRASYPMYVRLNRQLLSSWWPLPLESVTRPMVRKLHLSLQATPSHGNKGLGLIKQAYAWAQNTEDGEGQILWGGDNPATGIRRHKTYSRIRVMTDAELRRLLTVLDDMPFKLAAFLTILLCTGCRMSEAREMTWAHVDLEAGRWLKPTTKNGHAQYMPLPRQAVDALQTLPRQGPFIFRGCYGRCWSRAGAEKTWGRVRAALGLSDVWLHDFRRTVATRLYEAEQDELVVKACLNHYDGRPIAVYVRLNFDRLARALQAQADRLWTLKPAPTTLLALVRGMKPSHGHTPASPPPTAQAPLFAHHRDEEEALRHTIQEAWDRLPASMQTRYDTLSARSGIPLGDLLYEAVEWKVSALEHQLRGVTGPRPST